MSESKLNLEPFYKPIISILLPSEEFSALHVHQQHECEVGLPGDHDVEGGAHHHHVPPKVHQRQGQVGARAPGLGLAKDGLGTRLAGVL